MNDVIMLLVLLGVAFRVIVARGQATSARVPFINLSPALKPAKKISRKHLS